MADPDPLLLTGLIRLPDGRMAMSLEGAQDALTLMAESFVTLLNEHQAENYLEIQFEGVGEGVTVTLQRGHRPTANDLRRQAEARAEKAERALTELQAAARAHLAADEALTAAHVAGLLGRMTHEEFTSSEVSEALALQAKLLTAMEEARRALDALLPKETP